MRSRAYFLVNFTDSSFLACAVFFKEAVWSAWFSGFWGCLQQTHVYALVSVRLCLSACSGCGTLFLKSGFGVSTLMFKCLFGSPLVTSLPCAGVSALMFKNLFRRKRTATVSPTDRKHNRVSAA